jgi:hypothetical protein
MIGAIRVYGWGLSPLTPLTPPWSAPEIGEQHVLARCSDARAGRPNSKTLIPQRAGGAKLRGRQPPAGAFAMTSAADALFGRKQVQQPCCQPCSDDSKNPSNGAGNPRQRAGSPPQTSCGQHHRHKSLVRPSLPACKDGRHKVGPPGVANSSNITSHGRFKPGFRWITPTALANLSMTPSLRGGIRLLIGSLAPGGFALPARPKFASARSDKQHGFVVRNSAVFE